MDNQGKTGVLLVNLGTPDSPKLWDVFRYLNEFLTDGRVIDIPWLFRQLLVRCMIVPRRFKQTAKGYQAIWTQEGSPLKVYGYLVQEALQKRLGGNYHVELAMRYQNPSIPSVLEKMKGVKGLIVIPFFPQYASATVGSVHQRVCETISKWEVIPKLSLINHYYKHPALIKAFCKAASSYPVDNYDHILFSFHGLPERHVLKANSCGHCLKVKDCCKEISKKNENCYAAECYATAQGIMKALNIPKEKASIAFQSRLGKDPWLRPYTGEVIKNLARHGACHLLVFCPSFVCDCLETIEEIGVEYAQEFVEAGGKKLDLVRGLNDSEEWVETLVQLVTASC